MSSSIDAMIQKNSTHPISSIDDSFFHGIIIEGLRIASGQNPNPPIKLGMTLNNTIALQKPHFHKAGVPNILDMFNGTINVNIAPQQFQITQPDHEVTCTWFENFTETFWLVRAHIVHQDTTQRGYLYYPCPSEVKSHKDTTMEILTGYIPRVSYGDSVKIYMSNKKVAPRYT
jgi:hypothetical protein